MRIILYSLISLLLIINLCYAGDKEELQLKQAYLQEKIAKMEALNKADILEIRLLQLEYPQVREELARVTNQLNQLNQLQEKEKK